MKLAMISFTEHVSRLASGLMEMLPGSGYDCEGYAIPRFAGKYGLREPGMSLKEWTGEMFRTKDAILFISASGIAVRAIAPWVKDKKTDPAVVVMDERGVFAISLLSGHLGGANELTGLLANLTGAIPVITTATDVNGRFAVDIFAKKNGMNIGDMRAAKAVSADVLDEKTVGLYCEFPIIGEVPEELRQVAPEEPFEGKTGIVISLNDEKRPFARTLYLYPRIVTLGIGCRKGTRPEDLEAAVLDILQTNHIAVQSVERAASMDLKADEPAILQLCEKYQLPFVTYSAEELREVKGDFTPSDFVKQVTGVDNVCERSAVLGSGGGCLVQKKKAGNGITLALAVKDWSVDFG